MEVYSETSQQALSRMIKATIFLNCRFLVEKSPRQNLPARTLNMDEELCLVVGWGPKAYYRCVVEQIQSWSTRLGKVMLMPIWISSWVIFGILNCWLWLPKQIESKSDLEARQTFDFTISRKVFCILSVFRGFWIQNSPQKIISMLFAVSGQLNTNSPVILCTPLGKRI